MTTDPARIAADYLAALNDTEAAAFIADARQAQAETRAFARKLFAADDERDLPPHFRRPFRLTDSTEGTN